jgi:ubiquitin-conjugating enzyme (huntingtin interacting protein 2)
MFKVAKCHIKLELKNDSFTELRGEIAGPPDTPYEGAIYVLDIKIPETYPFNPPKVSVVGCYIIVTVVRSCFVIQIVFMS